MTASRFGISDDDRMVIAIAAYECHGFGTIRQTKSKSPLIERGQAIDISGVQIDVRESGGSVCRWKTCGVPHVLVNKAQHAAAGCSNGHGHPAIGTRIPSRTVEQRRLMLP
jgi:hypothetical protein